MAVLHVKYKHKGMMARLPRLISLNGRPVGVLQHQEAKITLPEGNYFLTVSFGGPIRWKWLEKLTKGKPIDLSVGTTEPVRVDNTAETTVVFCDRERWWNILFDIDLVLWFLEFFITLPQPWGLVYRLVSDGFFLIWLIRLVCIRKHYYQFATSRE